MSNLRVQTNQLCSIPKSPIYILQKTWEAKPRWGFVSMSMAQNLSNCRSQWEIPQVFFPHPQRNIGLKSRPLLPVPAPGYFSSMTNFQHFWCFRIRGFPMISSDLMIKLPFVSSKVHSPIVCVADPRITFRQLQTATARCCATSGHNFSGERITVDFRLW